MWRDRTVYGSQMTDDGCQRVRPPWDGTVTAAGVRTTPAFEPVGDSEVGVP